MSDFHHRGEVDLPQWAHVLHAPYWRIRVEGRNKTTRRKYYRHVEKIKLDLVERGHDAELVEAICRYLSNLRESSAREVNKLLKHPNPQMRLFFSTTI